MLKEYDGARMIKDFPMRNRDGSVTIIRAGTPCVVLDVYKTPPGYEMEFDYEGEQFNIGIPPEYVEPE